MTEGGSTTLRALCTVFLAACIALIGTFLASAQAIDTNPDFQLDFDTGGHRAAVTDLIFSADGETLVSASDDKTIRIWDWRGGVALKTLAGYAGQGNDGKIFAIALSPDGKTLAAAGYFGKGVGADPPYGDIRLFDLSTGRVAAVLKAAEYEIHDLAFSPDSVLLAAGGSDGLVYLWKKDEAAAEGWSMDRSLDADSWRIDRVAFAANGSRLAATTSDNGIRLWDLGSGEEISLPDEAEALRDSSVPALSVSQDGALFATGNVEGLVQIWRAADGALVSALPQQGFYIGSLAFAAGSKKLVVSCGYRCADKNRSGVWNIETGTMTLDYRGHDGSVFTSTGNADGSLIATAGGTRHAIQVWDPVTGEQKALLQGSGQPVTAVGIDERSGAIAWGNENPCPEQIACPATQGRLDHMLLLPSQDRFFESPEPVPEGAAYTRAVHAIGHWALNASKGGKDGLEDAVLEIMSQGETVHRIENDAGNGFGHSSFTLIDDGLRLITGGKDGTLLEYYSATARQAGEYHGGHTGEIHAMAAAEKAGLLVTGGGDQTIRLWNLTTRELVVSFLFAGDEWVAWMPQGYYYSSDEGDALIGWRVNQGRDKESRFVRAGQLKRYLWSPEMVRRAIILRSARQAVAEMRPGVDGELKRLLQRKPPEFDIRVAEDQSNVREGFVAVEITGAKEAGTDVSDFAVLSNSRNVGDIVSRSVGGNSDRTIIEVPVEDGENAIRITATNEFGYLTERSVVALGKSKKTAVKKGKLFVVVVGVEKYPFLPDACSGRSCDLRFPVDDAAEILNVLSAKTAPLFSGMESLVLLNREALTETPDREKAVDALVGADQVLEPDSDNIADQIEDFLDRPGPDDTTILFVAGHGINIDEDYYFIPTDGRKQDADKWKRSSLVDWSDIQKALERADGVRFMLLDTCHAANAFNPRLEKDAADARIVVFSATAANNTALELAELGHGVFTYSVLAGLRGAAKTSKDGVTLFGLADYISREITQLTGSRQKPFYYVSGVDNMVVAEP